MNDLCRLTNRATQVLTSHNSGHHNTYVYHNLVVQVQSPLVDFLC